MFPAHAVAKFYASIEIVGSCWVWIGPRLPSGYGRSWCLLVFMQTTTLLLADLHGLMSMSDFIIGVGVPLLIFCVIGAVVALTQGRSE